MTTEQLTYTRLNRLTGETAVLHKDFAEILDEARQYGLLRPNMEEFDVCLAVIDNWNMQQSKWVYGIMSYTTKPQYNSSLFFSYYNN